MNRQFQKLYDDGLSLREIAERFGVSHETVRQHITPRNCEICGQPVPTGRWLLCSLACERTKMRRTSSEWMKAEEKPCPICRKIFLPTAEQKVYCSAACTAQARRNTKKTQITAKNKEQIK